MASWRMYIVVEQLRTISLLNIEKLKLYCSH